MVLQVTFQFVAVPQTETFVWNGFTFGSSIGLYIRESPVYI